MVRSSCARIPASPISAGGWIHAGVTDVQVSQVRETVGQRGGIGVTHGVEDEREFTVVVGGQEPLVGGPIAWDRDGDEATAPAITIGAGITGEAECAGTIGARHPQTVADGDPRKRAAAAIRHCSRDARGRDALPGAGLRLIMHDVSLVSCSKAIGVDDGIGAQLGIARVRTPVPQAGE